MIFCTSCSSVIYLKKTTEPEILIVKKSHEIVFINKFDYTNPLYVSNKESETWHAGIKKLAEGLSAAFTKDESFKFFIGDTLKEGTPQGQLSVLLPQDSVRAICTRNKADILLSLDSMNISIDWETIVEEDASKTKNFYLYTTFYMSLYSLTGELINRSRIERSDLYKSRTALLEFVTLTPSIAKAKNDVETLAFKAGQDYVAKFYPQVVEEPRQIYTGKAFRESNQCIKNKEWNKAIKLLEKLAVSPDAKIADRAKQNLSVVKEAAGREQY